MTGWSWSARSRPAALPWALILVSVAWSGCEGDPGAVSPAAPSAAPSTSTPGSTPLTSAKGRYTVAWTSTPSPIPLAELFVVDVVLRDARTGETVDQAVVSVDARMPQHGHGMATRPEHLPGVCAPDGACRHPEGQYRTEGMKFHMPGEWVLLFTLDGPAGPDTLEVVYPL